MASVTFDLHKKMQNFLHLNGRRVRPLVQADHFVECGIAELPLLIMSIQEQKTCACLSGSTFAREAN